MLYQKTLLSFLTLTFTFSAFSIAFSQTRASVSGTVRDDTEAITGASVILKGTKTGTFTDVNGHYELGEVKPGTYTLVVSYIGYRAASKQITIKGNEKLSVNFVLGKDQNELSELVIAGKTKTQELKESGFAINAIETKKFANTTADINQILSRSTGVKIREQGGLGSNFNFSINGLSGKAVKYFIDGVPMEVFGSAMSLNNIPVNLAERIEVYKGVVPVSLGSDAMGGAVNVITDQSVNKFLDLSHSYGSFNTHRSALTGQFADKKTGIIFKGSAFYNYSDNNYLMRGVEVLRGGERNGKQILKSDGLSFEEGDVRRFNDRFQSAMGQLELGVMNKKWADVLFLGAAFSGGEQGLQTGFEQKIVYGEVARKNNSFTGSLRYKKDDLLLDGLSLSLFASRSRDKYSTIDTTRRQYFWDGSWTKIDFLEMRGEKTVSSLIRPRTFARANLSYEINKQHSLNLNYTADHLKNESFNELISDGDNMPGVLNKQIVGLAYQQDLLDKKLTNTYFAKVYNVKLEQRKYINNTYVLVDSAFSNYGYGLASRYKILPDLGIKASFEHAYRLQEAEEMFGDGLNVQPNPNLKPESSDNFNLGAYYGYHAGRHRFFVEASGFYRNAVNFIYPVPDQRSGAIKNENKSSVRITGFESEVRYSYGNFLSFTVNATYQNAINTTRFGNTESTQNEATYLNKIPNQPWLFGNADLTIGFNNIGGENTRLQFNWFSQYVHWFYLTWEQYGTADGKSNIPSQLVHNASLSYSLAKGKYNISVESRNLTDELSYDNFRLQKPGRAFSVKLRYFVK